MIIGAYFGSIFIHKISIYLSRSTRKVSKVNPRTNISYLTRRIIGFILISKKFSWTLYPRLPRQFPWLLTIRIYRYKAVEVIIFLKVRIWRMSVQKLDQILFEWLPFLHVWNNHYCYNDTVQFHQAKVLDYACSLMDQDKLHSMMK